MKDLCIELSKCIEVKWKVAVHEQWRSRSQHFQAAWMVGRETVGGSVDGAQIRNSILNLI